MPKEYINDRDSTLEDSQPLPFATIGWEREHGHVQLGVLQGGDYDEGKRDRPGFFVSLDRDGINRLIRTLRRARDAAFGADA